MNMAQLLVRAARAHPEAPAIFHGKQLYCDYQTLARRSAKLAGYLLRTGHSPGARAVIFMSNNAHYLEVLHGLWFAGFTAVPVNCKLHPREVAVIAQSANAEMCFISSDLAQEAAGQLIGCRDMRSVLVPGSSDYSSIEDVDPLATPRDLPSDHLAWLFYTSGTTGKPKGVMLTHHNLLAMTMSYFADVDSVAQGDAMIYAAPMSHGAGLYQFTHILKAARHVIPESPSFDPGELTELAAHHGRVSMFAAPTMVKRLVDHISDNGGDPSGFKTIIYGGGPMYLEDIRRALAVVGNRFVQIYGQGETPMTITALSREHLGDSNHERHSARIASVGIPQAIVQVRVADAEGNPVPDGEVGEILVRGDTVMKGYWNDPEASRLALRGGWLWTGDIGVFDPDGFLTLKDRSKDVIISGGSNIYPREVEEILMAHPDVREAAVVGMPSDEWGEQVVAFIVPAEGSDLKESDLDEFCIGNIARFKRPRRYHFVQALPKNSYGKIEKRTVRELADEIRKR
jgi:long-chain acyl-CoA synthetase